MHLLVGCTVIPTFGWGHHPCRTIWTHPIFLVADSLALKRLKESSSDETESSILYQIEIHIPEQLGPHGGCESDVARDSHL